MDISIITPIYNEKKSLPELVEWINKVCKKQKYRYEVLLVDDGSTDDSWDVIKKLKKKHRVIKGFRLKKNYGKSAALNEGFRRTSGNVVITMDADLQDSPDEIPKLYSMITRDKYEVVSGWKKVRYDNTFSKNMPSKLFNTVTRWISGIKLHDFNCGLKAYEAEVVKALHIQGEMHRYIPVLAKYAGYQKIGETVVKHQARKYGESKFGWNRFINGFLDLCTLLFMTRFSKKPMHFFGFGGLCAFLIGLGLTSYLVILKLYYRSEYALTERPSFFLALTMTLLGTMFFLSGFIAEFISQKESASLKDKTIVSETL